LEPPCFDACDNLDETSLLRIEYDKLLQYRFNKLATSCSQACYTLLTCLLQTCYNNLLQHCHDSLGTSRSTSCYKSVNKLLQVRHNKLLSAVRRHLVDKLLVQTCYKSAAGLLQVVRFYACIRLKEWRFSNKWNSFSNKCDRCVLSFARFFIFVFVFD
jgi:hypothetical protein